MPRRRRFLAIVLPAAGLLLVQSVCIAQSRCSDPESFRRAARKHQDDRRAMGVYRGLPPSDEDVVTMGQLTDFFEWTLARSADSVGILYYSLDADTLRVWLIGQHGIRACNAQPATPGFLDSLVHQLHSSLARGRAAARAARPRGVEPEEDDRAAPALPAAIRALTSLLLPAALRSELKTIPALIIVPTNSIGVVPFGLLQPYDSASYLIDRSSVAFAPNLRAIVQEVQRWRAPSRAVVVGNPLVESHPDWDFPPLPGAEREAETVASFFHTQPVIGPAATRDSILALLRDNNSDLLYVAAHGVANPRSPLDSSFLALAGHDGGGWWTARQIQSSALRGTELVVLSACQSGLGRAHGAGIIGLARAFQLAGVPRVVMSLWNVDDEATTAFMADFTREILGDSPNNALQKTMIRMRARDPDPRHWAAFTLFGSIL